jgi:hypothetical protein
MSTSPRNLKQAALYVEVPFRGPLQIGALAVTGGILLADGKETTPAWILGGNCIIRTGGPFLQGLTTEAPVRHPSTAVSIVPGVVLARGRTEEARDSVPSNDLDGVRLMSIGRRSCQ